MRRWPKMEYKEECMREGMQTKDVKIPLEQKAKRLVALSVCWISLSLAAGTSAAEKIRVGYVAPSPVFAPAWIAKEAGLFAKRGLDAEVVLVTGSPRLVQTLISGDVDYATVGATPVMRARMRGANVLILAATINVNTQVLLVSHKSGIRQLEDLQGRVIGVSQYGSEADVFARTVLSKVGLRPDKDVTILQLGGHPQVAAALVAEKIQAGVLAGGLDSMVAQKSRAIVLTSGVDMNIVSLGGTLAVSGHYVQRNRDSVIAFLRAFVEGFHYFKTNRDGTIPILQKYYGGITTEQARFLHDEYVKFFEELPVPREEAIQGALDRDSDPKAKGFKPADFVDLSFLKEINPGGLVEKLYRK